MGARGDRPQVVPPDAAKALGAGDYDAMWSRLDDFLRYNPGARHRRRLVLRALRRHASGAETVVDIGCGLGEMIGSLSSRRSDLRFTGVDFSSAAIESCSRRFPTQRWVVADAVNDDLPKPFDVVLCSELLEHLDEPLAALERITRSAKPGGVIIVTVPNGRVFATERAVGHVAHPTLARLREWCDAADVEVLEARRWGWPGYLALKYAANVDAERALAAFGSGRYSWAKRRANDVAYAATLVTSLPDQALGPQTVVVGRRRGTG